MSEKGQTYWFLSLKWKLLLSVLMMMLVIGAVLGTFAYRQLEEQQRQQLQLQRQTLANNLQNSLRRAVDRAVRVSQQVNLLTAGDPGGAAHLPTLLQNRWPEVQMHWDLTALGLYDTSGQNLLMLGEQPLPATAPVSADSVMSGPGWQVQCVQFCRLQVAVPWVLQGKVYLMLVETELTDILSGVHGSEELEFAVLGRFQPRLPKAGFWGRELFSISDRKATLPVLQRVASRWNWNQLLQGHQIFNSEQQSLAIWAFPLDSADTGPALVVLCDLSQWHQTLSQFQRNMLGIMLSALVLVTLLLAMLAWSPISRLQRHAKTLPLLAKSDYEGVRHAIPPVSHGVMDEVDNVERATLDLTDKLEYLQQVVVSRTQELEKLAMLDMLTGLPNRPMLLHELNKSIACVGRLHDQVALLFLDLDEFKRINDTLGHNEGDRLLKIVAGRLGESVRAMDTVFRQGGDEFLILVRGIEQEQEIPKVIHKIFSALQQPVVLKSHKLIITTSIGIAFCKDPAMSAEDLIKYAELAMYQAKHAGRSNYRVFSYDMLHHANNRMMVEQDIGDAIADNQLTLYLQPIVALDDGKLKGFEALIRWFHPERGLIMPGDFIPDIEHSDAIIHVGNYVLREGVRMLTRLQHAYGDDLYLAVNLSARHYLAAGLKETVSELLALYPVKPETLLLEVTEESVIEQVDLAMDVMHQLKELGIRIAIDDFGTGYSSLSYLKQLPFDVLKIDRCFTKGVLENNADAHIVTTVIELAHNLGRDVVAEGIETDAQEEFMRDSGCELAQGYLYSRPVSEEQVQRILANGSYEHPWPKAENYLQMGKLG
ncbi:bifunctional diguanylate cyclase/phosphodiesterase [Shewanella corallii]|uniref:Bifunctional diguanylate cyclase/phosphodiesterase n=1 Tax=Shewanella corallii TaxID=560080 RepID=A0ABT0N261_9GAMM|nr:bifunctional diguanylate cyclase/phosphodiesterase [Shewanella corallii]MCL2912435.1 bifunctional diguanylate cyclase/phosphodiesterase [Shewanella corallii]